MKKILKLIIFAVILYAFFAFGGYGFLRDKYDEYTSPPRAIFIQEEKDFGDLSGISADYSLTRSLNFFGYRKLNAVYLPKKQRIAVLDLSGNDFLSEDDFRKEILEEKLEKFSKKSDSPAMPLENVQITHIGTIKAGNYTVPYAEFEANVKMVPFFKARGTVAAYKTKNRENIADKVKKTGGVTTKLVFSCKFPTGYQTEVTKNFISQIKL